MGLLLRLLNMLPSDSRERWKQDVSPTKQTSPPKRFSIGAYDFGNMAGVTMHSRSFPWVGRELAGVARTWSQQFCFSSCNLSLNTAARPHKDSRNLKGSFNLSLPCSCFTGGEIFLEDEAGLSKLSEQGPQGHLV